MENDLKVFFFLTKIKKNSYLGSVSRSLRAYSESLLPCEHVVNRKHTSSLYLYRVYFMKHGEISKSQRVKETA